VAAAVSIAIADLPELMSLGVKDSKQLSSPRRRQLVPLIQAAVQAWHISYADVLEIEKLNIRRATLLAMQRCLLKLPQAPALCFIDGRDTIPELPFPQQTLIRGDQHSPAIAAASILAKVWRDDLMIRMAKTYPQYDLAANKGYGTKKHQLGLQQYGLTPLHRKQFCQKLVMFQTRGSGSDSIVVVKLKPL
jgi:ribonuclease HII